MKFNVRMLLNFYEVIISTYLNDNPLYLEHMSRMQSNELNQSTQSLALIMLSTIDQVLLDQEEDKMQGNEL